MEKLKQLFIEARRKGCVQQMFFILNQMDALIQDEECKKEKEEVTEDSKEEI